MSLDKIDLKIINNLAKENDATLTELGEKVNLSHVAVKKRLDKLKENDILENKPCINLDKLDYKIGISLVELQKQEDKNKLIKHYENCPRTVLYTEVFGKYNLLVFRIVKNLDILQSENLNCEEQATGNYSKTDLYVGNAPLSPKYFPLKFERDELQETPCGCVCTDCDRYQEKCPGCPKTIYYRD